MRTPLEEVVAGTTNRRYRLSAIYRSEGGKKRSQNAVVTIGQTVNAISAEWAIIKNLPPEVIPKRSVDTLVASHLGFRLHLGFTGEGNQLRFHL